MSNKLMPSAIVTLMAVTLALGAAAFSRNLIFHDEVTAWSDVIRKSPAKGRAFDALGYYYLSIGDHRSAIHSFSEAIRRHPDYAALYLDLAVAYERSGEYEKAIQAARGAVYWSELRGWHNARYHVILGDLYYTILNLPEALKEFTTASRIEPGNDYPYNKMGLIFRARGEYDEAIVYLKKAVELSPQNKTNKNNLDEVCSLKLKQRGK